MPQEHVQLSTQSPIPMLRTPAQSPRRSTQATEARTVLAHKAVLAPTPSCAHTHDGRARRACTFTRRSHVEAEQRELGAAEARVLVIALVLLVVDRPLVPLSTPSLLLLPLLALLALVGR